jgi:hypothetical protein
MTATLHRAGSRSTRHSAERERGPSVPASASTYTHPNTVLPQGSFETPNSLGKPELMADTCLAIPELSSFDQEELNNNPVFNELCSMPLIGALLLDRQLITRAQLDICLLLQAQTYPHLPIGQILIHKGYISQAALDHTLGLQAEIRASLNDVISRVEPARSHSIEQRSQDS